jgi:dihydrofolate reductase
MWNMVPLDGYFEGSKAWDLGWYDVDWGDERERLSIEQTSAADMLLFGRVTYEGMAAYWPSAKGEVADVMNTIPRWSSPGRLREPIGATRGSYEDLPRRRCPA